MSNDLKKNSFIDYVIENPAAAIGTNQVTYDGGNDTNQKIQNFINTHPTAILFAVIITIAILILGFMSLIGLKIKNKMLKQSTENKKSSSISSIFNSLSTSETLITKFDIKEPIKVIKIVESSNEEDDDDDDETRHLLANLENEKYKKINENVNKSYSALPVTSHNVNETSLKESQASNKRFYSLSKIETSDKKSLTCNKPPNVLIETRNQSSGSSSGNDTAKNNTSFADQEFLIHRKQISLKNHINKNYLIEAECKISYENEKRNLIFVVHKLYNRSLYDYKTAFVFLRKFNKLRANLKDSDLEFNNVSKLQEYIQINEGYRKGSNCRETCSVKSDEFSLNKNEDKLIDYVFTLSLIPNEEFCILCHIYASIDGDNDKYKLCGEIEYIP